jgi:hypothetical protein
MLVQRLGISKNDRIDSWEFRKKAGTVVGNFKKWGASFSVPMIETHKYSAQSPTGA